MNDVLVMAVRHRAEDLAHDALDSWLGQMGFLYQAVEELSALAELQDEVNALVILVGSIKPHNARMIHLTQHLNFFANVIQSEGLGLIDSLDSPHGADGSVSRLAHCSEGTFPKGGLLELVAVPYAGLLRNVRQRCCVDEARSDAVALGALPFQWKHRGRAWRRRTVFRLLEDALRV